MGPSSLKWSPASSGSCSSRQVASDRVLFQHNPVSRSNQALGRQDAGSWAAGNSLDADKFNNRLTFVLRHDPPCFVTDYRTSRDCGIRHLPLFGMLGRSTFCDGMYPFVSMGKMVNGGLTRQKARASPEGVLGSVLTGQGTVGAPMGVMSSRQQPDADPKSRSGPIGSATTAYRLPHQIFSAGGLREHHGFSIGRVRGAAFLTEIRAP